LRRSEREGERLGIIFTFTLNCFSSSKLYSRRIDRSELTSIILTDLYFLFIVLLISFSIIS